MSPKMRVCLALLILFSIFSLLPAEKKMKNSMEITLSKKSIPLTVVYSDWQSSLEVLIFATNALKCLESSIGIPYPPNFGVEIMLGGDPAGHSYYMGNGRIELLMTRHWRGALAHELAHLWFNYQTLPPWIAEGASELYAYEVFVSQERYGEALDYRSRSTSSFTGREPPLDHFKWRGKEEENYAKAMMLFLHLRDVMGMEGLRQANAILFGEHMNSKVSSTQYEEILKRTSPEHAHEISSLFQEFVYIKNGEEPGLGYVSVLFFIVTLCGEKILNSHTTSSL